MPRGSEVTGRGEVSRQPPRTIKAAARAFDEHSAYLVLPLLDDFQTPVGFDGIDFSNTIYFAHGFTSEAAQSLLP